MEAPDGRIVSDINSREVLVVADNNIETATSQQTDTPCIYVLSKAPQELFYRPRVEPNEKSQPPKRLALLPLSVSQPLLAGDREASQPARVICAYTEILEHREPNRASAWIISRQDGQFRTYWNSPEKLGFAAHVDRANRDETARDDLGTPKGSLQTSLEQSRLALDVENVSTKLPDVRVVPRVHVHARDPKVVALDEREGVGKNRTGDRCDHRNVGVRLARKRVESHRCDGIKNGEDTLIFRCLNLRPCEILCPLNEVEATLLDLG